VLRRARLVIALTLCALVVLPAGAAASSTKEPLKDHATPDIGVLEHVGNKPWSFEYSPDPGVEYTVTAEILINRHDVTGDLEGIVRWSGDYQAVDGYLQLYRDGVEVSSTEEAIAQPASEMDGEWYRPPPSDCGCLHNYYAELSGI
jgi:hypothetical protein